MPLLYPKYAFHMLLFSQNIYSYVFTRFVDTHFDSIVLQDVFIISILVNESTQKKKENRYIT